MPFFTKLRDTPESILPGQYLRGNVAGDALVSATKEAVLADLLGTIPVGSYLRVRDIGSGVRGLEGRTLAQVAADTTARWRPASPIQARGSSQTFATLRVPANSICSGVIEVIRGSAQWKVWWSSSATDGRAQPATLAAIDDTRSPIDREATQWRFGVLFTVPATVTTIYLRASGLPRAGTQLGASSFLVATLI